MKIGIDISQTAYGGTGVSNYLEGLVSHLVLDENHQFVLFFSSFRRKVPVYVLNLIKRPNVTLKHAKIPPTGLHFLWNVLHKVTVEQMIGPVDLFITSDWTEPPTKKAKKATILYDLIVYKYPEETHGNTEFNMQKLRISPNIVDIQKKKLSWVKKESDIVFCISESTKKDAKEILKIPEEKLKVIYPGI